LAKNTEIYQKAEKSYSFIQKLSVFIDNNFLLRNMICICEYLKAVKRRVDCPKAFTESPNGVNGQSQSNRTWSLSYAGDK
jgi:hypothetical protein